MRRAWGPGQQRSVWTATSAARMAGTTATSAAASRMHPCLSHGCDGTRPHLMASSKSMVVNSSASTYECMTFTERGGYGGGSVGYPPTPAVRCLPALQLLPPSERRGKTLPDPAPLYICMHAHLQVEVIAFTQVVANQRLAARTGRHRDTGSRGEGVRQITVPRHSAQRQQGHRHPRCHNGSSALNLQHPRSSPPTPRPPAHLRPWVRARNCATSEGAVPTTPCSCMNAMPFLGFWLNSVMPCSYVCVERGVGSGQSTEPSGLVMEAGQSFRAGPTCCHIAALSGTAQHARAAQHSPRTCWNCRLYPFQLSSITACRSPPASAASVPPASAMRAMKPDCSAASSTASSPTVGAAVGGAGACPLGAAAAAALAAAAAAPLVALVCQAAIDLRMATKQRRACTRRKGGRHGEGTHHEVAGAGVAGVAIKTGSASRQQQAIPPAAAALVLAADTPRSGWPVPPTAPPLPPPPRARGCPARCAPAQSPCARTGWRPVYGTKREKNRVARLVWEADGGRQRCGWARQACPCSCAIALRSD